MADGEASEQMARLIVFLAKKHITFSHFVYNMTCIMYSKVAINYEAM